MTRTLDCVGVEALEEEAGFGRISNQDYLALLREHLWTTFSDEQRELYEKLLASSRARLICSPMLEGIHTDDHEARYGKYKTMLERLTRSCVSRLVEQAGVDPRRIKAVVTNHTVGGICPPISSIISNELGLDARVRAFDLAYMGCSAALLGIDLARAFLKPGEAAIVFSAEITSVMMNLHGCAESLVANCVFGDGVGAFLLCAPPHPYRTQFRIKDVSGSLIATDDGLECIHYEPNRVYHEIRLEKTIPQVAAQGIEAALRPLVRRNLVTLPQKLKYVVDRKTPVWQDSIDYVVLHAAGRRVLEGVQSSLSLTDRQVGHNYRSFDRNGNTSSTSIHYSLKELQASTKLNRGDRVVFLGYGSGFMTQAMLATIT